MKKQPHISQYAAADYKKVELAALANEVREAEHQVEENEAIVASLTIKHDLSSGYLARAETNRSRTLDNKNLFIEILNDTLVLQKNSKIACDQMIQSNIKSNQLSEELKVLVDQLINASEVAEKLSTLVIRKKAINPLISDEFVSMVTMAVTDANNSVALTLVALKSTYSALSGNTNSKAICSLEYEQIKNLCRGLTAESSDQSGSLNVLINTAYEHACTAYSDETCAVEITSQQLNEAQDNLNTAQNKLESLQAGLDAANVAVLAS